MKFSTICLHGGKDEEAHNAHLSPIYASSTYLFNSAEEAHRIFKGEHQAYVYGRFGNPTIEELQQRLDALEAYSITTADGQPMLLKSLYHASGMGAIATLMFSKLKTGDALLTHKGLYGGTQELLDKVLADVDVTYCFSNGDDWEQQIIDNPHIAGVYIETPSNPALEVVDIEMVCKIAHKRHKWVVVDNTFATPYLQQPFKWGADYVVHSATKFINGHGTSIGGFLVYKATDPQHAKIVKTHRLLGANSNGFDAFLTLNGLKTLPLRMQAQTANAQKLAQWLTGHPKVQSVKYLGLDKHPSKTIVDKQMRLPGAVLSFEIGSTRQVAFDFLNKLRIIQHAVSLGTCDTLVCHPASTTHFGVPEALRLEAGITDQLVRMSVGIEDINDLMADIEQALS